MPYSRSKYKSSWLLLLGIATVIGLGFAFGQVLTNSSAATDHSPTSTPPSPESVCAQGMPDWEALPPEKQAMAEAEYHGCVEARQSPLPPPNSKPETLIATPAPLIAGIARRAAGSGTLIEHGLAPLPAMGYVILNSWLQETGEKRTVVYAGARRDDPGGSPEASQGVIVVMIDTLDFRALPEEGGEYPTPVKAGPVRIVEATGMQLTLVTQDGQAFFFNVASRQFIFPGPKTPVQRVAGAGKIIESQTNSFALAGYDFVNQWHEAVNGKRITVLAGAERRGSQQGIIVVILTSLNAPTTILSRESYLTPIQFGAVRIVEAKGEQLTLATSEGGRFVFDLASRQFVSWPEIPQ